MPRKDLRLTKCSICGQPALAGGRLCAPCRAALKRARDTTVSEAMPQVRRLRALSLPLADMPAPSVEVAEAPARRRVPSLGVMAIAAACIVLTGIVWFIRSHTDAGAAASQVAGGQGPNGEASFAASADATVAQAPVPAAFMENDRASVPVAQEPPNPRRMPSSIAVPRGAPREPPPAPPEPFPTPSALPEPPPAPAPIVVAQAPPPKAVPDRWQRLTDQLAACPTDPFKRAVCQESLRIESCEGYWGRVPPCPARPEREYGN